MAQVQYPLLNNFSRGELSSRMDGRVDLQGYYQGCKQMQNCIMVSQGGAEKRPGTIYLGETFDFEGFGASARLISFEVADDETYILELGHRTIRIWDSQTKTLLPDVGNGSAYLMSPYSATTGDNDVAEIQYAMTEGKIFFAHPDYEFRYIERIKDPITGDISFVIGTHNTIVYNWDNALSYNYKDVVRYNGYWRAVVTKTTSGQVPAVGSWLDTDITMDGEPSSNISLYTGGAFSAGDFCLFGGDIYEANHTFTPDGDNANCYPGVEITTETKIKGEESTDRTTNYVSTDSLRDKLEGDGYTLVIISRDESHSRSGSWYYVTYRLDYYKKISTVSDDSARYWSSIGPAPNGSDTTLIQVWATGSSSADYGELWYNPSTFKIYTALANGTTIDPGDFPEWESISSNPFFSVDGDFPAAVAFMNQRLYLGGTLTRPQTIFGSKIGDFSNFNGGTDDDDSFSFEIAAERSSRIKWMMAKDNLMIGTTSSEWLITGGSIANITPTNVQVLRQSSYGSAYSQAQYVADSLLFYQKGGRKLREYMYSNDNKAYLANDLTFFADHITESGISESAYQLNPDSIMWNIKKNGGLIGLTYDRLNSIFGWHNHNTKGTFESICVVEGATDEEEVWVVCRRTINGSYVRNIEVFANRLQENMGALVYSDSATVFSAGEQYRINSIMNHTTYVEISYVGESGLANGDNIKITNTGLTAIDHQDFTIEALTQGESTGTFNLSKNGETFTTDSFDETTDGLLSRVEFVITGLDHLDGEEVVVLGDGAVYPSQTVGEVDGGVGVVLNSSCNSVVCGLEYEMVLQPQSIEISPSTFGATKRISKVMLKLYQSLGGRVYSPSSDKEEKIQYRTTETAFGAGPPLYTGNIEIPIESSADLEAAIVIKNKQPVPMTVMAIVSDITNVR